MRGFKELRVWQGAMDLVESVYRVVRAISSEESYGLRSQIRRASVSIPSNIAEGQSRASTKEFLNHLSMAQASLAEVETQLEISVRLKYLAAEKVTRPVRSHPAAWETTPRAAQRPGGTQMSERSERQTPATGHRPPAPGGGPRLPHRGRRHRRPHHPRARRGTRTAPARARRFLRRHRARPGSQAGARARAFLWS